MRTTRHLATVLTAGTIAFAAMTACRGKEPTPSRVTVKCSLGMYLAAGQDICISGSCGNGSIDPGEACDDGNRIAGDGCSPDCGSIETCGNAVVDQTVGEVCDDGNLASGDACCSDCRSCPELAVQVETEPPRDSLPDTQPCSDTLAEALSPPDILMPPNVLIPPVKVPVTPARRAARRSQAQNSRALDHALANIAELERTNMALQQSLLTERQQHDEFQERVARGRTDELD